VCAQVTLTKTGLSTVRTFNPLGVKGTGIWSLNPKARAGKMGLFEQFKEVSIPGILDLEDHRRNQIFYDRIREPTGETLDDKGNNEE
jgi:hypothetical protein